MSVEFGIDPCRTWTCPVSGSDFVEVPAGPFLAGQDRKRLKIPAFWMARHPITNAQWLAFVEASNYAPPVAHPRAETYLAHWVDGRPPIELERHPVTWVSFVDALHYVEWARLALPSEWWWEKAACGADGSDHPWGNTNYRHLVSYRHWHRWWNEHPEDRDLFPNWHLMHKRLRVESDSTVVVDAFEEVASAYGCQQMLGNISEWCWQIDMPSGDFAPAETVADLVETPNRLMAVRGSAYLRRDVRRMVCHHRRRLSVTRRNGWTGFRPCKPTEAILLGSSADLSE